MPSFYTAIEINAPRSVVWQALIRKENWLRWNTYLYDLSPGQPFRVQESVSLSLKRASRETETPIDPRITVLQPTASLQWVYVAPGFLCEHGFELQDMGGDRTRYTHRIRFTGLLSGLFLPFIRREEQQGSRRMAQELKRYLEGY